MPGVEWTGNAPPWPDGHEPAIDVLEEMERRIRNRCNEYVGKEVNPEQRATLREWFLRIAREMAPDRPDINIKITVDDDDPRILHLKVYSEEDECNEN